MKGYLNNCWLCLALLFPIITVAQDGPLYRSTDNGQSWHTWSAGLSAAQRIDRILTDDQTIYVLSERQGLFRSTDGGKHWIQPGFSLFLPKKIDAIHKLGSLLYAGTYQEGVYVSADQGNSWVAVNQGLTDRTIRAFHSQDGHIWVGTNDGLYIWDTAAAHWKHQLKAVQVNAIAQGEGRIFVATHQGLQNSADGGRSWSIVLDQGAIKQLYAFDGQIYACAMTKEVWKYNAKADQWVNVTASFPAEGYSSSILYMDQDAIYVAQGQQLYRKTNHQTQWEQVGMPLSSPLQYRDLKMVQPGILLLACVTKP